MDKHDLHIGLRGFSENAGHADPHQGLVRDRELIISFQLENIELGNLRSKWSFFVP